jgi:hypothetical protein
MGRGIAMKREIMRTLLGLGLIVLCCSFLACRSAEDRPRPYGGTTFKDQAYSGGPQAIPGRVKCAYYDQGGEGVAYHDSDAKNNGSGGLNPADGTYLNEFRMKEGVDTSYTKFHDEIDHNPYNMVDPEKDQLYVGWTEPGEWFNMTVSVETAGVYTIGLMYTSNRGGAISFDLDGAMLTKPIPILSTNNPKDPIAWRQWHHWNRAENLATVTLPQGKHVLTLHVVEQGNMNFDYLEFKRK